MARRIGSLLIIAVAAGLAGAAPTAGQSAGQDTLRRLSPEEYQAMRRQWLEARRLGLIGPQPTAYGSAVVGVPAPGTATGTSVPGGGLPSVRAGGRVELLCEGWLGPTGPGPGIARRRSADEPFGRGGEGIADAVRPTNPRGPGSSFDGTCVPYGFGPA
jgi:hypothetical protein